MDTSTLESRGEVSGRKVVTRRFRSLEDKLQIIREARAPGASVAAVARSHDINANLVFAWMRQEEQGVLSAKTRGSAPALLAVRVEASTPAAPRSQGERSAERVEIELPDGTCVRAYGSVPWQGLERVLRLLRR
jgi:transposase